MRIKQVDAIPIAGRGSQGAYGAPYGIIVRVRTDDGIVGYGESDSMPSVVKAIIEAPFLHEMMSGLKWVLLDQDPADIEALWRRMARATLNYSRDGATLWWLIKLSLHALAFPGRFEKESRKICAVHIILSHRETIRRAG